jgi:hypothetical protein
MDLSFLTSNVGLLAGGGTAGIMLWVLKKVPNDKIYNSVEKLFKGLGVAMTLGLGKFKLTKKYWNSTIEPWVIDLVENTIGAAVNGFVKGLRSDK